MAIRSPPRGTSRPKAGRRRAPDKAVGEAAPEEFEDVAVRAARFGITPERVLREYARIAFADLRHIVEWDAKKGLVIKAPGEWGEADAAAVSEIVPGADPGHSRIKLYNKKAALDVIARHLGMFPLPPRRREDEPAEDEEDEDPREFLVRELARRVAGAAEE